MEEVKTMKDNNKSSAKQAGDTPVIDAGVAVLEGEIDEVDDYTALLEMQHDPLRVMHKDGRKAKEAFPDWHFAWVRNGKDQRRNDIGKMQTMRYELVTTKADPDVKVFSLGEDQLKASKGRFEYNELTLMKLPMRFKKERDIYLARQNAEQMRGLGRDFLSDPGNDAYVPDGGTTITRGG